MAWWNPVDVINGIVGIVKEPVVEWQKRKTIKQQSQNKVNEILAEAEVAKATIRLELARKGQTIEADWDARAQESMKHSWKDEYLLFILTLPIIGSFIPGVQDHVAVGWGYVADAPQWYIISFLGLVAATFGLRWLIRPLVERSLRGK